MLHHEDIQRIKDTTLKHSGPMLSVYVDVNPSLPENDRREWKPAVKDAFRNLPAPDELKSKVMNRLDTLHAEARTKLVFAAEGLLESLNLHADLPLMNFHDGRIIAKWGSRIFIRCSIC